MDQTAITYPTSTLTEMTGERIKSILEDICDNLFNPDPYRQQGGDMVRVGGMSYACEPNAAIGARISDMRLGGKPIEAHKVYKVAGWAPVDAGAQGEPIWEVVDPLPARPQDDSAARIEPAAPDRRQRQRRASRKARVSPL